MGCDASVLENHEEKVAWRLQLQRGWVGRNQSSLERRGIGEYLPVDRSLEERWWHFGGDDGCSRPYIRHLSLRRENEISLTLPGDFGLKMVMRRCLVKEGAIIECEGHVQV